MNAGDDTRLHRAVFMVSFAISALLSLWLAFEAAAWALAFLFLGASLIVMPMLMRWLVRSGHRIDWVLSVAALNLFIVVPELGLRLSAFSYESGIQFGYPRPSKMIAFEPDAELFWRLPSSDPDVNSLGVPGYLLEQNFASDIQSVVRVHREYIRMTRQIAAESGAGLLDLAAIFNEVGDPEKYFLADGIHFTRPGLEVIARRIAGVVGPVLAEAEAQHSTPATQN